MNPRVYARDRMLFGENFILAHYYYFFPHPSPLFL